MIEYAQGLIQGALGVWFAAWAVRRRYKLDHPLDQGMQMLRWAVIALMFGLALVPGTNAGWLRVCGLLTSLAFLCWPNLAYRIVRLFRGSAHGSDSDSGPSQP